MKEKKRKLFCELNPFCFTVSHEKEVALRHIRNILSGEKIARKKGEQLPNVVFSSGSDMIKRGKDIDPVLQENKVDNIKIASDKISKIIIHTGEVFSFNRIVGKATKQKGYKDGRVIVNNKLIQGIGGGLCNLANTIHLLVLHSPLDITEFHMHSDALAPDPNGKRVPFSAGTSVWYNNIDYKFQNNTDQCFQLVIWCEGEYLKAELCSERELSCTYRIEEENHHFEKQNGIYYRISQIYKLTIDKATDKILKKELVLNNHSKVMFDYDLIPKDLIMTK